MSLNSKNTTISESESAAGESASFDKLLSSVAILVVDDEPGMRNFLKRSLEKRCAVVKLAASAEEAEALRLSNHFDLLLVDIRLPKLSGLEWLNQLREAGVQTHVIYMTAYADLNMAIAALRNGADDFIMKPFRTEQVFVSIQLALQKRQILRENSLLRLQLSQVKNDQGVIGKSSAIRDALALAERVAPTSSSVLIKGEPGTGKELVARAIHGMSNRSGPFVTINCAAIDPERFESELFGHLKGAFKDATESREGLFLHADGGTLFLDEVGDLPLAVQTKLACSLENKKIRQLGSDRRVPINVRVIASSSENLESATARGSFRSDLHDQLNVLPIDIPSLRERPEDIPALVEHFFTCQSARMRIVPIELMHTDWQRLSEYHWPGNVRELKNVIERTLLLGRLPADSLRSEEVADERNLGGYPLAWTAEAVERAHIEAVLKSVNNNKSAAARQLGVSRKTLERKQNLWQKEKLALSAVQDVPEPN